MNKIKILAIMAVISVIMFGYISFATLSYIEETELNMSLQVSDYAGFNIDTDAIYFGTVTPGGSSKRIVTINNIEQYPIKVLVLTGGNLSSWVMSSENNFRIDPGEGKNITLIAKVPENADYGNYNGVVKMRFKKLYLWLI